MAASNNIKPVLDVEKLTSAELMETFQKWDKDGTSFFTHFSDFKL